MSSTLTHSTLLTVLVCGKCGIEFAIPERWDRARRDDGKTFYCPNGDPRAYTEAEADRLQKKIDAQERNLAREVGNRRHVEERLARERKSHASTKGQLTKTKKRVGGGVCPCGDRAFVNLGRHMAGQHPDYIEEANDEV